MNCIRYAEGYKYQLRAPYSDRPAELEDLSRAPIKTAWIELDPDGSLRITVGYAWDGASGPTYDSPSSMRGSLGHDALYQLMRLGLLDRAMRPIADAIFQRQCKEDGMWTARAKAWFYAVRIFAAGAAQPAGGSPDLCAPGDCGCSAVAPIEPDQPSLT